jgi:hypothetical protein
MATCPRCDAPLPSAGATCTACEDTRAPNPFVAAGLTVESQLSTPPRSAAHKAFVPGTMLSERYRIISLLGRGGMGEVYRADDLTLGQQVALKFLPPALARDQDALRRFRNEVRVARQISHPNVCRVYDIGEVDGAVFLSMEYVDGEDLASLLRRIGRLPSDKGLEIARRLCAGLAAAHEKGVLHRDLKPANVMLDARGQLRLTDFGLAGLAEDIGGADVRSGTPAYMAPEQLTGNEATIRSDLYALGLVLYELFTGRRPHDSSSLQELQRLRLESAPEHPSSFVRDLDPALEGVILRCLDPDPSARPSSALAVAAALPGGDPLAAALAAGETPSPQLVAAAGEAIGVSARYALALFGCALAGLAITAAMAVRTSALERMAPEYPPDVLTQRARDVVASAGYNARPADSARGFSWNGAFVDFVVRNDTPRPDWAQVIGGPGPSLLRFWYRQGDAALTGVQFHSDLLIPGEVTPTDPPPLDSGMIGIVLDARGRLISFAAVPPRVLPPGERESPAPDWRPLFAAAGVDADGLQPAEPIWTWLATSDSRFAWTGTWPHSTRPLRVEAAALRGKPVAFALLGPWDQPGGGGTDPEQHWREGARVAIYGVLALVLCAVSAWLAWRNLSSGRGDRRGAFRLAVFAFSVHMALWLTNAHIVLASVLGIFFLALCTSVFYAVVLWTIYLAAEPYVRRQWPRSLISWTRLLSGEWRDPLVGRDVLWGVALGTAWTLVGRVMDLLGGGVHDPPPTWTDENLLLGLRQALGEWLARGPHGIRDALMFFFLLFVLRVVLRRQWLAAAAFVVALTLPLSLRSDFVALGILAGVAIYGLAAIVILRFGLLALVIGFSAAGFAGSPVSLHTGAWYFANTLMLFGSAVALAAWAFHTSLGSTRLWRQDLFR